MKINKKTATDVLHTAARLAEAEPVDPSWRDRIEKFSEVCDESTLTHIAFLGTALLAKSVHPGVDVWAVKARDGKQSYSARGLGHGVLVPNAPMLGINLGVTGREPLNNQPYFQIDRVSRTTTVHGKALQALNALCDILEILERMTSATEAQAALRAFIYVRRQWNPPYSTLDLVAAGLNRDQLITVIEQFVGEESEGGKRAQAVVAGLMDLFAGPERVRTTRIHDPDRHFPGDVCVLAPQSETVWEKVFEVRDKRVAEADLYHFAQKASDAGATEAAVVAIAMNQQNLDITAARSWAQERSVNLTLFHGWRMLVQQVMFWASIPTAEGVQTLPQLIFNRLVKLEVSVRGTELWRDLTTQK